MVSEIGDGVGVPRNWDAVHQTKTSRKVMQNGWKFQNLYIPVHTLLFFCAPMFLSSIFIGINSHCVIMHKIRHESIYEHKILSVLF